MYLHIFTYLHLFLWCEACERDVAKRNRAALLIQICGDILFALMSYYVLNSL